MATVLFIGSKDLKKYTLISGNLDSDKILQWVDEAQDFHIQNYLGTTLYNKVKTLVDGATIGDVGNEAYKTLLDSHIRPSLIRWTMVELLPMIPYLIANGGLVKTNPEGTSNVDKAEVDFMIEQFRTKAQYYTNRMIDYICDNSSDFPEYSSNSGDDITPNRISNFGGWVL